MSIEHITQIKLLLWQCLHYGNSSNIKIHLAKDYSCKVLLINSDFSLHLLLNSFFRVHKYIMSQFFTPFLSFLSLVTRTKNFKKKLVKSSKKQ